MKNNNLKDVTMPDGLPFDEYDWKTYSDEYVKLPVKIRALKLECPVKIETREGIMMGNVGDWLIQGVEGEFYPCKDEIFLKTYTKAELNEI